MEFYNCIYRFLNENNEIIYIGKAKNLKNRLNSHHHLPNECYEERKKIEFTMFETEDDMDFAERYYIPKIKPKYNDIFKERAMTLSIDKFDDAKWYKYTKSLKIKEDELEGFQTNLSEVNDAIKLLKSKISIIVSKMDNIDKQQDDIIKEIGERPILEHISSEIRRHFIYDNEGNEIEQKEYGILYEEWWDYNDELKILNGKLYGLQKKKINIVIGNTEFKKMDEYMIEKLIKYNTYNITEILNKIYDDIINKYIEKLKNDICSKGYYLYSDLISSVYSEFHYCAYYKSKHWVTWIDPEILNQNCKSFYTYKIKIVINKIIEKIEDALNSEFGKFKEETIIQDLPFLLDSSIKYPQAVLIKKIA